MINKAKEFEICTSDEPARARCEVDFVSYEAKSRMDLEGISEKILCLSQRFSPPGISPDSDAMTVEMFAVVILTQFFRMNPPCDTIDAHQAAHKTKKLFDN